MELPRLQPLYEKYRDQGFEIVAIDGKRDTERAVKFIEDKGLTYTMLENGEGDDEIVRKVFDVRAFPTSYLIDREGRILFYHLGFEEGDEDTMEAEIEKLLGI